MDRILSLIEHYGYPVVLFEMMLESTGGPLPGATILLAAGVLVQRGHLDLEMPWRLAFWVPLWTTDRLLGRTRGGHPFVS